jgi:hypothetical protein
MGTPRRSGRVAAQETRPDYTEPNESGRERKRKSEAGSGSSPSAKRGRKTKSKENLKEQKTLEEVMDVYASYGLAKLGCADDSSDKEEPKPDASQAAERAPVEKKDQPQPPADLEKGQQTIDQVMNDAPAKETETERYDPAQSEMITPAPQPSTASNQTDGEAETEANPAKVEDDPAEEPKETKAAEAPQPEKPAEQPQPPTASASVDKAAEQPAENGVSAQPQDSAPQSTSANADSSTEKPSTNGTIDAHARDEDVPSSILEKGIIYFFFRSRVNVTDPSDVKDIARSYMILRPLPHGAALGDGPIPDSHNARLLALPKKVLPTSGKDRFMVFVEKAKVSFSELKNDFMSASEYATQSGTSQVQPVTPLAEGVYAITTTGRASHLAYTTTIPSSLGEVQKDVGLRDSGSFVVSAKNPKHPGPANVDLGKDPGFSEKIMSDFRDLRWMPLKPEILDYANAQVLLIGEDVNKALEGLPRDERDGKEEPKEEMEKLEGEDEVRVKHLKGEFGCFARDWASVLTRTGDDAIFKDLGISKNEYPKVPTTW